MLIITKIIQYKNTRSPHPPPKKKKNNSARDFSSNMKAARNCHTHPYNKKKFKQAEQSMTFLGPIREVRTQGKPPSQDTETQAYPESLLRLQDHPKQKPLESSIGMNTVSGSQGYHKNDHKLDDFKQ